jgi:hypothetical protein
VAASRTRVNPYRATFRPKRLDVAWQKELRDRHTEPAPFDPIPSVSASRVRPISYRLAEQVILRYEWLGTMAKTQFHYGLFFGMHLAGATCTGVGGTAGNNVHRPFELDRQDVLTLARGACVHWAPSGSNSRLVNWTVRLLAKRNAGKVMIAYADSDAGEIGTIYQACNWVYIGRGGWVPQYVAPNGRVYDCRIVSDLAGKSGVSWVQQRDAMVRRGWVEQRSNPKHRYAVVLDRKDKALLARVESMRQPYPKRLHALEALSSGATASSGKDPVQIRGEGSLLSPDELIAAINEA